MSHITNCSDQGYQKAKRYYNNTTQDDLDHPENIGIDGKFTFKTVQSSSLGN